MHPDTQIPTGAGFPIAPGGRWAALACCLAAVLLVPGCRSSEDYREEADREVYAIVTARRAEIFGDRSAFTIDPDPDSLRQRLLRDPELVVPPFSLQQSLGVAAENSREYQRRKENLYLSALDLTLERWRFQWQERGILGAFLDGTGDEAQSAGGTADFGLTRLLGTGAVVVADLGFDVARSLSSGDGWKAMSDLGLAITQPLLRGSGELVVMESLTQAERNLVYAVRSFERYRRTFAVDVTSRLYRLLQRVDTLENEEVNYASLVDLVQRNEALAEAGRLSDIQVDQARQDELRSENRLLVQRAGLEQALDDFKLFLGLPVEFDLELDLDELERLQLEDIAEIDLDGDLAVRVALQNRLDYRTSLDVVEDDERAVYIAQDDLRASLDVVVAATGSSADNNPARYKQDDIDWTLGLDLDLPLERMIERNNFRAALITLERSKRDTEEFADQITADVRDELRQARSNREENEIQRSSVTLAERRVESARLNLEAGRADTRDVLEAQDSLLLARNGAIATVIDYTLSRLDLYRDMELLRVDERGVTVDTSPLEAAASGGAEDDSGRDSGDDSDDQSEDRP